MKIKHLTVRPCIRLTDDSGTVTGIKSIHDLEAYADWMDETGAAADMWTIYGIVETDVDEVPIGISRRDTRLPRS